jgi:hypothetical protein
MPRLSFGASNIYLRTGLVLLGIASSCAVALYFAWPVTGRSRMLLSWGLQAGLLGGIVLYAIGRITQVLRSRASK